MAKPNPAALPVAFGVEPWSNVHVPSIWALGPADTNVKLSPKQMTCEVDIHASVAFSTLKGEWQFTQEVARDGQQKSGVAKPKWTFLFELPTRHTTSVMEASIILPSGKAFDTMVVDAMAATGNYRAQEGRGMSLAMHNFRERSGHEASQFHPELFSFPFYGLNVGDTVRVEVRMLDTLDFRQNRYHLLLPYAFNSRADPLPSDDFNLKIKLHEETLGQGRGKLSWNMNPRQGVKVLSNSEDSSEKITTLLLSKQDVNVDGTTTGGGIATRLDFSFAIATSEVLTAALFEPCVAPGKGGGSRNEGHVSVFVAAPDTGDEMATAQIRGPRGGAIHGTMNGTTGMKNTTDYSKFDGNGNGNGNGNEDAPTVTVTTAEETTTTTTTTAAAATSSSNHNDSIPTATELPSQIAESTADSASYAGKSLPSSPDNGYSNASSPTVVGGRDVVFILDRSGSMGFSKVFEPAVDALAMGLDQLGADDRFAICAFDHNQLWFAGAIPPPRSLRNFRVTHEQSQVKGQSGLQRPEGMKSSSSSNKTASSRAGAPASEQDMTATTDTTAEEQQSEKESLPFVSQDPDVVMLDASGENKASARRWLAGLHPGGLTDILTPLRQATVALGLHKAGKNGERRPDNQPIVFLVTDGAVDNERDICRYVSELMVNTRRSRTARISTFGIGFDCNSYMLRMLANVGRGYTDIAMSPQLLETQMISIFQRHQRPLVSDLSMKLPVPLLQQSPKSIPDLANGVPIVVNGSLSPQSSEALRNNMGKNVNAPSVTPPSGPEEAWVYVKGVKSSDGSTWETVIPLSLSPNVPLHKIFAKAQLEEKIAESWLADVATKEGRQLKNEAIELAVRESLPSPYTQLVAYETTEAGIMERRNPTKNGNKTKSYNPPVGAVVLGATVGVAAFGSISAAGAMGSAMAGSGVECCPCFCCGDDIDCECFIDCLTACV